MTVPSQSIASLTWPAAVEIAEVGLRDGFQGIKEWIPTETKIEIAERLVACGFKKIELGAFVHPKAVPQMRDAAELNAALKAKYPDVTFVFLAPNARGVQNAVEAGVAEVSYIISASEHHNMANTKQTIDQSIEGLRTLCAEKPPVKINLAIPTAFMCPWSGKVPAENTVKIVEAGLELGITDFGIADTIGSAQPLHVRELVLILKERFPSVDPILHLHDTRGMGLASLVVAMQSGVHRFETAFGGLGGCPFAPGAAGNIASEDAINMLHGMGIATGVDLDRLVETVRRAEGVLPTPINSHLVQALACATHVG